MLNPKGKLVIIGGAVDLGTNITAQEHIVKPNFLKFFDRGILRRIITESANHEASTVEVVTTASQIPELVGIEYIKAFNQLNVPKVDTLHIKSREDAHHKAYLDRIRKADVVVFTGGDQLRLSSIFGGTEFLQILKNRYHKEHFIIAGTSAGAAAASNGVDRDGLVCDPAPHTCHVEPGRRDRSLPRRCCTRPATICRAILASPRRSSAVLPASTTSKPWLFRP